MRSSIKDGPEQLQEMHAEYARKESDVLKSYQHKAEHNLRGDPKEGSSEQPKPVELSDEDPGAMKEFVAQKAPKRKGGWKRTCRLRLMVGKPIQATGPIVWWVLLVWSTIILIRFARFFPVFM